MSEKRIDCETCEGNGWIGDPGPPVDPCPDCKGSGKLSEERIARVREAMEPRVEDILRQARYWTVKDEGKVKKALDEEEQRAIAAGESNDPPQEGVSEKIRDEAKPACSDCLETGNYVQNGVAQYCSCPVGKEKLRVAVLKTQKRITELQYATPSKAAKVVGCGRCKDTGFYSPGPTGLGLMLPCDCPVGVAKREAENEYLGKGIPLEARVERIVDEQRELRDRRRKAIGCDICEGSGRVQDGRCICQDTALCENCQDKGTILSQGQTLACAVCDRGKKVLEEMRTKRAKAEACELCKGDGFFINALIPNGRDRTMPLGRNKCVCQADCENCRDTGELRDENGQMQWCAACDKSSEIATLEAAIDYEEELATCIKCEGTGTYWTDEDKCECTIVASEQVSGRWVQGRRIWVGCADCDPEKTCATCRFTGMVQKFIANEQQDRPGTIGTDAQLIGMMRRPVDDMQVRSTPIPDDEELEFEPVNGSEELERERLAEFVTCPRCDGSKTEPGRRGRGCLLCVGVGSIERGELELWEESEPPKKKRIGPREPTARYRKLRVLSR